MCGGRAVPLECCPRLCRWGSCRWAPGQGRSQGRRPRNQTRAQSARAELTATQRAAGRARGCAQARASAGLACCAPDVGMCASLVHTQCRVYLCVSCTAMPTYNASRSVKRGGTASTRQTRQGCCLASPAAKEAREGALPRRRCLLGWQAMAEVWGLRSRGETRGEIRHGFKWT